MSLEELRRGREERKGRPKATLEAREQKDLSQSLARFFKDDFGKKEKKEKKSKKDKKAKKNKEDKNMHEFYRDYTWGSGEQLPTTQEERLQMQGQMDKLKDSVRKMRKRNADDARLVEGDRIREVLRTKSAKVWTTLGRCSQQLDESTYQMGVNSDSVHSKVGIMLRCAGRLQKLAAGVLEAHDEAMVAGRSGLDVAAQLLAAGEPDTEPAKSDADGEDERGIDVCRVLLKSKRNAGRLCGRPLPCKYHGHK